MYKLIFPFFLFLLPCFSQVQSAKEKDIQEIIKLSNVPYLIDSGIRLIDELVENIFREDLPGVENWDAKKVENYKVLKKRLQNITHFIKKFYKNIF